MTQTMTNARPAVAERRLGRSYMAPGRVDERTVEDRPLTAEQSAWVGRLAKEHGDHLVRYIAARLGGAGYWARAEDIAQEVWLAVARGRVPELLEAEEEVPSWRRLAACARVEILTATTVKRRRERLAPADWQWETFSTARDETACAVLELVDPQPADASGPGWAPACYAERIAGLPPRQREVLELRCIDGMTTAAIAARLGITRQTVEKALRMAVTTLGGSGTVTGARTRGAGQPLPAGWEQVVDRLPSEVQREVVRLRAAGASFAEVATQLDVHRGYAHELYTRAVRLLREMVADHRLDPVQAAPAAKSTRPCAQKCTAGCYLRAGR